MKSKQGFSLPELLLIVCAVGLVACIGVFIFKHERSVAGNGRNEKFSYAHADLSDANAQDIVSFFESALSKNFHHVDSFLCGSVAGGGGCASVPPGTISILENGANDIAPGRRVSGYDFYALRREAPQRTTALAVGE